MRVPGLGPKGVAPGCGSEREAIHFSILCVRRGHANREGRMRPPGFGLWASEASWVGWGSSSAKAFLPKLDDSIAFWSFLSVSSRRNARKAKKLKLSSKYGPPGPILKTQTPGTIHEIHEIWIHEIHPRDSSTRFIHEIHEIHPRD